MSDELGSQIGELRGRLDTYLDYQKIRDEKLDQRHNQILESIVTVNNKAESAHRRISKYKYIGTGIMATGASLWGAAKFLFANADTVAKDIDKLKGP